MHKRFVESKWNEYERQDAKDARSKTHKRRQAKIVLQTVEISNHISFALSRQRNNIAMNVFAARKYLIQMSSIQ